MGKQYDLCFEGSVDTDGAIRKSDLQSLKTLFEPVPFEFEAFFQFLLQTTIKCHDFPGAPGRYEVHSSARRCEV